MRQLWLDIKKNPRLLIWPLSALLSNAIAYDGGRYLGRWLGRTPINMSLPIENKIPFVPWNITIYVGCFVIWYLTYIWVAYQGEEERNRFYFTYHLSLGICFLFYIFLPTTVSRPEIVGKDFWSIMVRVLYFTDATDNLFPSVHCICSYLCWVAVRKNEKCSSWIRWGMLLMAVLVFVSTLTLKQHVLVDIPASILVCEASYAVAGKVLQRKSVREKVSE